MTHIDYFKQQAKNLLKDCKTQITQDISQERRDYIRKLHQENKEFQKSNSSHRIPMMITGKIREMNCLYKYKPKYFDIQKIIIRFHLDEDKWTLMNAQHTIANIVGFRKWSDLIKAPKDELEYRRFLFDNEHKLHITDGCYTEYDGQLSQLKPLQKVEYLNQILADDKKHQKMNYSFSQQKGFRINKAS